LRRSLAASLPTVTKLDMGGTHEEHMKIASTISRVSSARPGHVALEFGVVVPVFFAFLFGLIEIGRGYNVTHLLNNAARSACRQAILSNQTTETVTAQVNGVLAAQSIAGASTTVKVNGTAADAATASSGDDISVLVTIPVGSITWIPGMQFLHGNLAGQFSLRKE
jgi:Flp pilus assembly protein TadG